SNAAGNDPLFHGGYAQLSWFVTGETRPYKAGQGVFGRPAPARPLDLQGGGAGALELAARLGRIDLSDNGINGGTMNTATLGANWYVNPYIRFMGNAIFADTDAFAV